MSNVSLPPWLATIARALCVRGETWSTDGWAAWAIEPPEGASVVKETEKLDAMLLTEMDPLPFTKREHVKGFVLINDTTIVSAHYLDLAERLFPGITWKKAAEGQIVGFRGGRARSVIMPANEKSLAAVQANEYGGYPRCWDCNGTGGDYCEHCDRGTACPGCDGAGVRKNVEDA